MTTPKIPKGFKRCYKAATGQTKYFAPKVWQNSKMMARLGWQILPEIEELPSLSENQDQNGMLQQSTEAQTAETPEVTQTPEPAPEATTAPPPADPPPSEPTPPSPTSGAKRGRKPSKTSNKS